MSAEQQYLSTEGYGAAKAVLYNVLDRFPGVDPVTVGTLNFELEQAALRLKGPLLDRHETQKVLDIFDTAARQQPDNGTYHRAEPLITQGLQMLEKPDQEEIILPAIAKRSDLHKSDTERQRVRNRREARVMAAGVSVTFYGASSALIYQAGDLAASGKPGSAVILAGFASLGIGLAEGFRWLYRQAAPPTQNNQPNPPNQK